MSDQVTFDNVCLSGGADGSDLQWAMMAGRLGHKVVHWSFAGHRTEAPQADVVVLSHDLLIKADDAIARANRTLQRNWPSRSDSTNNLLRRNWYQVKDTCAVYAVGTMERGNRIKGGTAWAIQMYMDRFTHDGELLENCNLYFYDEPTGVWWQWRGTWSIRVSQPATPTGLWTGIGVRDITSDGKWMIRKVMGGYPVEAEQIAAVHPTIQQPAVGDIIYVPNGADDSQGKQIGGWATVNRILTATDEQWVAITEYMNTYFAWSELAPKQEQLRREFGLNHALTK